VAPIRALSVARAEAIAAGAPDIILVPRDITLAAGTPKERAAAIFSLAALEAGVCVRFSISSKDLSIFFFITCGYKRPREECLGLCDPLRVCLRGTSAILISFYISINYCVSICILTKKKLYHQPYTSYYP
jgi:hypothetical protein